MDYPLGIDVGSTSMEALVYDLDGNVVAQGSHPTESIANDPEHPNWQVYQPDHIWDGVSGVSSAINEAVNQVGHGNRIRADAVPLDSQGEPVYRFINWLCTRKRH